MIHIDETGARFDYVLESRESVAGKIASIVGVPWKIWGTVVVEGDVCYVVGGQLMHTHPQNHVASRMAGKILWGDILFVKKGVEIQ
jgi:hypothetical protein